MNLGTYDQVVAFDGVPQTNAVVLVTYAGRIVTLYTNDAAQNVLSLAGEAMTAADGRVQFRIPYLSERQYTLQVLNADRSVRYQKLFRPNPPMVEQPFLPYVSRSNQVLGLIPIAPTTFAGTETTTTVSGNTYNTRTIYLERPTPRAFLAIDVTPTEERGHFASDLPGLQGQTFTRQYYQTQGYRGDVVQYGTLLQFLLEAAPSPADPVITYPAPNNVTLNWKANAPFSNASGYQFIDLNVQVLSGLQGGYISRVVIDMLPTTSHAAGSEPNPLRAMSVQATATNAIKGTGKLTEAAVGGSVRVIKAVQGTIPTGNYVWNGTLIFLNGQTSAFTLTITVV